MSPTATISMADRNKATVRAYVEKFNAGDFESVRALCTPDVVIQGVLGQGGFDTALPIWRDLHEAYGLQLRLVDLIAEGDVVAARYEESGTFVKPFRGTAHTGKSFLVVAMEWFRLRDGKIAERWGARDAASIHRQLAG